MRDQTREHGSRGLRRRAKQNVCRDAARASDRVRQVDEDAPENHGDDETHNDSGCVGEGRQHGALAVGQGDDGAKRRAPPRSVFSWMVTGSR